MKCRPTNLFPESDAVRLLFYYASIFSGTSVIYRRTSKGFLRIKILLLGLNFIYLRWSRVEGGAEDCVMSTIVLSGWSACRSGTCGSWKCTSNEVNKANSSAGRRSQTQSKPQVVSRPAQRCFRRFRDLMSWSRQVLMQSSVLLLSDHWVTSLLSL